MKNEIESKNTCFALCQNCLEKWSSRKYFVIDEEVTIAGYIANFTDLSKGTFLFEHNCSGFIKLPVENFLDLYKGETYDTLMYRTAACPGYCEEHHSLQQCSVKCKAAMVRDIIQTLKYFRENMK